MRQASYAICCNRIMWGVEGFEEISIRQQVCSGAVTRRSPPGLESVSRLMSLYLNR